MVIHWLPLLGALNETWDKLVTRPRHIELWDTAQLQHPPTAKDRDWSPGKLLLWIPHNPKCFKIQIGTGKSNVIANKIQSTASYCHGNCFIWTKMLINISPVFNSGSHCENNLCRPKHHQTVQLRKIRLNRFHCDSVSTFTSWRNQPLDLTKFGTLRILDPPMEGFEPV